MRPLPALGHAAPRARPGSARKLQGVIEVPNNDAVCKRNPTASAPSAPCTIKPNDTSPPTGLDIFQIGCARGMRMWGRARGRSADPPVVARTIMEIVDTDLDDVRILQNRTYRDDGIIVVVEIKYSNFEAWSGTSSTVTYSYKMNRLLDTNYKEENAIYNEYPKERVWRDKHGIKLVVLQTGQVGQFDITTLLVQITTSCARPPRAFPYPPVCGVRAHTRMPLLPARACRLTLLATATLIVDLLALRVLPQRQDYTKAKIEVTEDFSDLRERACLVARLDVLALPHRARSLAHTHTHQGSRPRRETTTRRLRTTIPWRWVAVCPALPLGSLRVPAVAREALTPPPLPPFSGDRRRRRCSRPPSPLAGSASCPCAVIPFEQRSLRLLLSGCARLHVTASARPGGAATPVPRGPLAGDAAVKQGKGEPLRCGWRTSLKRFSAARLARRSDSENGG